MIALLILAIVVVGTIFRGLVLVKLWAWFVVPVFHLPILTLAPAIGLSLIVGYFVFQGFRKEHFNQDNSDALGISLANMLMYPAIVLAMGWIITLFL